MKAKRGKNISFDEALLAIVMDYCKLRGGRVNASDVVNAGLVAFFEQDDRHELIHRGRDADLQVRRLRAGLDAIAKADEDEAVAASGLPVGKGKPRRSGA